MGDMPSHTVTQGVNTLPPLPGVYVRGDMPSHTVIQRVNTLPPLPGVYVRGDMPSHTVIQRVNTLPPQLWSMSGETCHLTVPSHTGVNTVPSTCGLCQESQGRLSISHRVNTVPSTLGLCQGRLSISHRVNTVPSIWGLCREDYLSHTGVKTLFFRRSVQSNTISISLGSIQPCWY